MCVLAMMGSWFNMLHARTLSWLLMLIAELVEEADRRRSGGVLYIGINTSRDLDFMPMLQ